MISLLQAATMPQNDPTAWQLLVALAGVASFMILLVAFGIAYGKLTSRIEYLEKRQDGSANITEVERMFEDIKARLRRIEDHFDRGAA